VPKGAHLSRGTPLSLGRRAVSLPQAFGGQSRLTNRYRWLFLSRPRGQLCWAAFLISASAGRGPSSSRAIAGSRRGASLRRTWPSHVPRARGRASRQRSGHSGKAARPISRAVTSARTRLSRSSARRKSFEGCPCEVNAASSRGRDDTGGRPASGKTILHAARRPVGVGVQRWMKSTSTGKYCGAPPSGGGPPMTSASAGPSFSSMKRSKASRESQMS
jgi:hypothetical protein